MKGFLYYFAEQFKELSPADAKSRGLGHALTYKGITCAPVRGGPDGGNGTLVVMVDSREYEPVPNYNAAEQVWRQGKTCWVGYWKSEKPGPAALARPRVIDGESLKLQDGQAWTIPVARSIVRGSTLPSALVLGADHETWELKELPEFLSICADAERLWESLKANEFEKFNIDAQDMIRVAVDALAVNYRVGPQEVSLLELLSTYDMKEILLALVDFKMAVASAAEALQKKSPEPAA